MRRAVLTVVGFCAWNPATLSGQSVLDGPETHRDTRADAIARPTDPGANTPLDPELHRLPDLLEIRLDIWAPIDPANDLFDGEFAHDAPVADFFRLDIVVDGLVNPPGPTGTTPADHNPYAFGDHPIYGFVEIDVDGDVDTGGELEYPWHRYLGNVARFGGKPFDEKFRDRVALDASAFDGDITTPPFVDRSGEEFHVALLDSAFDPGAVAEIAGNADAVFDAGETWRIVGKLFHRAHGFEGFSFLKGGQYEPETTLQFRHDPQTNCTEISLVFPLTQRGAALMRNEPVQPANLDAGDHTSVFEALYDLWFSAEYIRSVPTGDPNEAILLRWADQEPGEFLDPDDWEITALFGSAYSESNPLGVYYLWSDVFPDPVRGDVDGDAEYDEDDVSAIEQFITTQDGLDGIVDGVAVIPGFARNFSVFDINHDGVVSDFDLVAGLSDADDDYDDDVDLADFATLQNCFDARLPGDSACIHMDLDVNGTIDLDDMRRFRHRLTGPLP